MRFAYLLILLVIPALGGNSPQLFKTALLAIGVLIFARAPHIGFSKDGKLIFWLGLTVLGCALVSTATISGPLWGWTEGFIGKQERVEGWLCLAAVFVFAWFAVWNGIEKEKEGFAVALLAMMIVSALIWLVTGIQGMRASVGGWLGIASLFSIAIPVVIAWGWDHEGDERSPRWFSGAACGIGALLLVASGCRAALLGTLVGLAVMWLMGRTDFKRSRFRGRLLGTAWLRWASVGMIGLIAILCLVMPSTDFSVRQAMVSRLASVNPLHFGHGARTSLGDQLWQHGILPFGWGIESQGHLIDTWNVQNKQVGTIYDRFHTWPGDILAVTGWLGLAGCLAALWLVARAVWENRREWWVRGFSGGLTAFLVGSLWNPPCMQTMLLAGIMVAGIFTRGSPNWAAWATRKPYQEVPVMFWLRWTLIGVAGVAAVFYGAVTVGDRFNAGATARCNAGTALPHTIMARQWMGSLLNPWVQSARIQTYYAFHKYHRIWEPEGGAVLLKQLLQNQRSDPALIALLYGGLCDVEMCKKWLEVAKMSAPAVGKPVDRLSGLVTDGKGRIWNTLATGPKMRVEEVGGKLRLVMEEKRGLGKHLSIGRTFGGFTPGAACAIVAMVINSDGQPHLFLTTDPVWDKRTYCDMKAPGSHEYHHEAIADEKGEIAVRMVCEVDGEVTVEDVMVRVKEEAKP